MAIFKCKMCGGSLEIMDGATTGECQYCGTMQTLPKLNDDKKANMYDRANHFRRNNEFDKARAIYEQILNEDNTDAESYWSIILCQYGIEYVEDPVTHKRVPTVNRAQFTSVLSDENYKKAIEYADVYQKSIYEEEAKAIDEIQKGILEISQKEEPFDVFICYKETDNNGRRTPDSVLAQELYYQLKQEGFNVFFSRITLEDKLGSAYEPYIFAALNSAKVMIVVGTKQDHFNAVWVKNEWSRYLALIKEGKKKTLIPAYRDMDPYDLPDEFSHLQAQDMSKLGFMQDIIRGIKKITENDNNNKSIAEPIILNTKNNVEALLKRVFMFLEDGDYKSANEYCEKVLDIDPECAQAYLGKLFVDLKVKNFNELDNGNFLFDENINFKKIIRFGNEKLTKQIIEALNNCKTNIKNEEFEKIYRKAVSTIASGVKEMDFINASELLTTISGYKDSDELYEKCIIKIETIKKDNILTAGKSYLNCNKMDDIKKAISLLESISGYKDSDEILLKYYQKISEIKINEEKIRIKKEATTKKVRKIIKIIVPLTCLVIAGLLVFNFCIIPNTKYKSAIELVESGNIIEGYEALIELDGYKDSDEKAEAIFDKYNYEKMLNANVGDYIFFGKYEQDNILDNGKEDIEWLVLEKKNNSILVTTKYIIDCKKYDKENYTSTWEDCSLRKYLNDTFINETFSSNQKKLIQETNIKPHAYLEKYEETDPGNNTIDKVFLLSGEEAEKYFITDKERQCRATLFAINNGAEILSEDDSRCIWSLRSGGYDTGEYVTWQGYGIAVVRCGGSIRDGFISARHSYLGVRPAMWIDLTE